MSQMWPTLLSNIKQRLVSRKWRNEPSHAHSIFMNLPGISSFTLSSPISCFYTIISFLPSFYFRFRCGSISANHGQSGHRPNSFQPFSARTVHALYARHAHSMLPLWLARPHLPTLSILATRSEAAVEVG